MNTIPNPAVSMKLLGTTLALGVLGDALLRATPWGLNILLWIIALTAGVALLCAARSSGVGGRGVTMLLLSITAAGGIAFRDSRILRAADAGLILVCLALLAWRAPRGREWLGGVAVWVRQCLRGGFDVAFGAAPMMNKELPWPELAAPKARAEMAAVLRGFVVAVPLLVVFGGLLLSADAVFRAWVLHLAEFEPWTLLSHLVIFAGCAWLAGGLLRSVLRSEQQPPAEFEPLTTPLGVIEINVIIASLNLLFLAFIIVQCRYLFGGADVVAVTPGITYAEYARRGFFELIAVSALALPVMLLMDWLLPGSKGKRLFRLQAVFMVMMLLAILYSALLRMRLYQDEYGLTELRFYATACMAWLAAVLAWFLLTVGRGRREFFVVGSAAMAVVTAVVLHIMNPDAWIVRANAAHAQAGHSFDADYALSLGADAVPALTQAAERLPEDVKQIIRSRLAERWAEPDQKDWRTWNFARAAAKAEARRLAGPPPASAKAPGLAIPRHH